MNVKFNLNYLPILINYFSNHYFQFQLFKFFLITHASFNLFIVNSILVYITIL